MQGRLWGTWGNTVNIRRALTDFDLTCPNDQNKLGYVTALKLRKTQGSRHIWSIMACGVLECDHTRLRHLAGLALCRSLKMSNAIPTYNHCITTVYYSPKSYSKVGSYSRSALQLFNLYRGSGSRDVIVFLFW